MARASSKLERACGYWPAAKRRLPRRYAAWATEDRRGYSAMTPCEGLLGTLAGVGRGTGSLCLGHEGPRLGQCQVALGLVAALPRRPACPPETHDDDDAQAQDGPASPAAAPGAGRERSSAVLVVVQARCRSTRADSARSSQISPLTDDPSAAEKLPALRVPVRTPVGRMSRCVRGRKVAAHLARDDDRGRVDVGVDLGRLRHDHAARHVDLALEAAVDVEVPLACDLASERKPAAEDGAAGIGRSAVGTGLPTECGVGLFRRARESQEAPDPADAARTSGRSHGASLSRAAAQPQGASALAPSSPARFPRRGGAPPRGGSTTIRWSLTSPAACMKA